MDDFITDLRQCLACGDPVPVLVKGMCVFCGDDMGGEG